MILNAAIAVLMLYVWLRLVFNWDKSTKVLVDRGLRSIKYFTVQSNLFSGGVSVACVIAYLALGPVLPTWLLTLKLVATTAVMLTFIAVIAILVPTYDVKFLYMGSNFWMHLVLPLLAAIDCCFLQPVGALPWQATLLSVIPTALYGVEYLRNLIVRGAKENGVVYDFYHFLRWGKNKVPVVALVALASTWGLSVILHAASHLCYVG